MRNQRLQVCKKSLSSSLLNVAVVTDVIFLSHFLQDYLVRVMAKDLMHSLWKHLIKETVGETPLWTTSPRKGSYLKSAVMMDFKFAVKVLRVSKT